VSEGPFRIASDEIFGLLQTSKTDAIGNAVAEAAAELAQGRDAEISAYRSWFTNKELIVVAHRIARNDKQTPSAAALRTPCLENQSESLVRVVGVQFPRGTLDHERARVTSMRSDLPDAPGGGRSVDLGHLEDEGARRQRRGNLEGVRRDRKTDADGLEIGRE
jgi:hypothetical protein